MSLDDYRIQDPVLTQLSQGYHNAEFVGEYLFPAVEIPKEAGRVPQFGRLAFLVHSTIRELHGASNRLTPEYSLNIPVVLEEHDVEYPIDYREEHDSSYQVKPMPGPLKRITAGFDSVKGRIEVEITRRPDSFRLHLVSPPATRATVCLPLAANGLRAVRVGGVGSPDQPGHPGRTATRGDARGGVRRACRRYAVGARSGRRRLS